MDPQQQQQFAGLLASMGVAFFCFMLVIVAFAVFLFWRVFTKAGMAGPLGLLVLVPGIGWVIAMCILAFTEWKVTPIAPGYTSGPPSYPPPAYPPSNYPPTGPPTQL